jgi:hypothetical protein
MRPAHRAMRLSPFPLSPSRPSRGAKTPGPSGAQQSITPLRVVKATPANPMAANSRRFGRLTRISRPVSKWLKGYDSSAYPLVFKARAVLKAGDDSRTDHDSERPLEGALGKIRMTESNHRSASERPPQQLCHQALSTRGSTRDWRHGRPFGSMRFSKLKRSLLVERTTVASPPITLR